MEDREDYFGEELNREVKPAPKPAPKPKAEPEPEEAKIPGGLTKEDVERVRRDIWRMWNAEPEETR